MKVNPTTHLLTAGPGEKLIIKNSPNQKAFALAGGLPKDLIIHYTACALAPAVSTFMQSGSTSAHLIIDTNGDIYQMVPFNRQAYHAGYSVWDEASMFNGRSIGIELINFGWDVAKLPAEQSIALAHKHKFNKQKKWNIYPDAQLKSLYNVAKALMNQYHLNRTLGHDDISAGRKQDPGPAFPWDAFKMAVFGQTNNVGKIYKVKSADGSANLRKTDSTQSAVLQTLPNGFEVGLIETWNNWSRVYLCNSADQVVFTENGTQMNKKIMGWVSSGLLELKP